MNTEVWQHVIYPIIKYLPSSIRTNAYKLSGLSMGNNSDLSFDVYMDNPKYIVIGDHSHINKHVKFYTGYSDLTKAVEIGNYVHVGPSVSFISVTHELGGSTERAGKTIYVPIKIGDGSWIGARAIILPGVSIAAGCIIAAGAVVTKSTECNGLYAGVPARRIKDL